MPEQSTRSSVFLDVAPGRSQPARQADPDEPFRILVLGDFSGGKNRQARKALGGRRPVPVDRDNLDDVIAGMQVSLQLAGSEVRFRELEDFHPDRLYARFAAFRSSPPGDETPITPKVAVSGADLLESILSGEPEPRGAAPPDDLAEFIQRAVRHHLVPKEDSRELDRAARARAFHSDLMGALLHHPDFQALEAAWRGLDLLVRGLDTDGTLRLYVFDATIDDLMADSSELEKLLVSRTAPWGLVVGNFVFGRSPEDVAALIRFGKLAQAGGAPFVAESEPPSDEDAPDWRALRGAPEAHWLGLALPRFLLRLPYGKDTSPIESFPFEEMPRSNHSDYLWGNPAFCCAYLLGQSFADHGWDMTPGTHKQINSLPLHVYKENGETEMKPCAEMWMTDSLADSLMDEGTMPLASLKRQDAAILVRFQSIAEPLAPLAGRWSSSTAG